MQTLKTKFVAFVVALTLIVGAAGVAPIAHAESGSGQAVSASASNEMLIKLLQELIKVLQAQLAMLTSDLDESSEEEDAEDEDRGLSELEATVYLNETLIKVELDDDKEIIRTSADSRSDIIGAILDEYDQLSEEEVDAALTIEEEDRYSRNSDLAWADDDQDENDEEDDEDDED